MLLFSVNNPTRTLVSVSKVVFGLRSPLTFIVSWSLRTADSVPGISALTQLASPIPPWPPLLAQSLPTPCQRDWCGSSPIFSSLFCSGPQAPLLLGFAPLFSFPDHGQRSWTSFKERMEGVQSSPPPLILKRSTRPKNVKAHQLSNYRWYLHQHVPQ